MIQTVRTSFDGKVVHKLMAGKLYNVPDNIAVELFRNKKAVKLRGKTATLAIDFYQ